MTKQYYFKIIHTTAEYKDRGLGMRKIVLDKEGFECPNFFVMNPSKNQAIDRVIAMLQKMKDIK